MSHHSVLVLLITGREDLEEAGLIIRSEVIDACYSPDPHSYRQLPPPGKYMPPPRSTLDHLEQGVRRNDSKGYESGAGPKQTALHSQRSDTGETPA